MSRRNNYRGINSSQLIKKVSQIPALWDRSHKHYKNRQAAEKYWLQLAHELGSSVEDIRKRWKSIRSNHQKEKIRRDREPDTEPRYHFYDECDFLNVNYEKPSDLNETIDSGSMTDESSNNAINNAGDEDFSKPNESTDCEEEIAEERCQDDEDENTEKAAVSSDNNNKKSSTKRPTNRIRPPEDDDDREIARLLKLIQGEGSNPEKKLRDDPIAVKQTRTSHLRAQTKRGIHRKSEQRNSSHDADQLDANIPKLADADKAFFVSLLPHLRKLNSAQKLQCRMDIQRIIYKYAYENV